MSKRYRGISDSQANAEALARRSAPYSTTHAASVSFSFDYTVRLKGESLRELERAVRIAYRDEIPPKLHDGPDEIGDDGTPKWNAHAEGYIFGHPEASDAKPGDNEILSYYFQPFRALLHDMSNGKDQERRFAAIVSHVTIGQQSGVASAITEGIPSWAAYIVAESALRAFLLRLSDVKVHLPKEPAAA